MEADDKVCIEANARLQGLRQLMVVADLFLTMAIAREVGTALDGSLEKMATPPARERTPDPTCWVRFGWVETDPGRARQLGWLVGNCMQMSATMNQGSLSCMHLPHSIAGEALKCI